MEFALGKRRRRGRKSRSVRPKTKPLSLKESESSSASPPPPASIIIAPSVEDYNPDIPASQDQERSDDLDIPASQEHSAKKKLPHDLFSSDGSKVRIEYNAAHFASSPGDFPTEPPTFETAREVGGGWFYYDPSGGKELGWLVSWYTVPDSHRVSGEKSPPPPVWDDLPDCPDVPMKTIDELFAYIDSVTPDYDAYVAPGNYKDTDTC
ncbi:hypothetical protein OROMI_023945 [Orobanche minor]